MWNVPSSWTIRTVVLLASACGPAFLWAGPSLAQVIEIAPDGEVSFYGAPAVFTGDGVVTIGRLERQATPPQPGPGDVSKAIRIAADRYGLSYDLLEAVAWKESRFRQSAVSPKGAIGVMQLMSTTATGLRVDPHDLFQNVSGGAGYLRQMLDRYDGNVQLALAAYNAGPGAVGRYGGIPPFRETRDYVAAILERMSETARLRPTPPLLILVSR